jgi:D-glycero-beta-D-manno-heptose 1-phosphate adenylyltransferase
MSKYITEDLLEPPLTGADKARMLIFGICRDIARVEPMGRIVSQEELIALLGRANRGSSRIVFTNGCFDLLHPGHIRTLEEARSLGDVLVVGLNRDVSVQEAKGDSRPVIAEDERAELLASLEAVDFVVLFAEPTPRELITRLLPDVLVKGADWGSTEIVGREEVERAGGRVVSITLEPGYSTTGVLQKIRNLPQNVPSPASR